MKKSALQKFIAIGLAGIMAMGTLTACGSKPTNESVPATSNDVEIGRASCRERV